MVLVNLTEAEINQLRHVCSRPDAKIKYLALAFTRVEHSTSKIVKIVAQAYDKLSAPVWREQLGCRIREVKSAGNLKQVVDAIRNGATEFIEYGSFGRQEPKKTGMKRKMQEDYMEDDMCEERVEHDVGEKLSDKQALLVHRALIMARDAYLKCYEFKLSEQEDVSTGSPHDTSDMQLDDISGISRRSPPLQEVEKEKRNQLGLTMARDAFLKRMRMCELDLQRVTTSAGS